MNSNLSKDPKLNTLNRSILRKLPLNRN
jgi:hypothetical protein